MWRGELTPRKVFVLARQLPAGAQTWIAMGSDAAWTTGEHLSALGVDVLMGANWQRAGGKGKKPEPVDRPADIKKAQDREARVLEKAALFEAIHGVPEAPGLTPPPDKPKQPRDERGRFVSRKG